MAKKIGRNDPCHCGSGKKYKHCHLPQDQAQQLQQIQQIQQQMQQVGAESEESEESISPQLPMSQPHPDPDLESPLSSSEPLSPSDSEENRAANERWERFVESDIDGKVDIFLQTLAAGKLDEDEAFEVLNEIRESLDVHRDPQARVRYAQLVERLRREAPTLYHHSLGYYNNDLIDDAIADGRWESIPKHLSGFAEKTDANIDIFFRVIEKLIYHGQTKALVNAMRQAWPKVSESDEILPHGISKFAKILMTLKLFDYLETSAEPRADDQFLRDALTPYGEFEEFDPEWLERAIRHLSASSPSPWHPDDFGDDIDAEQWERNLEALLLEFMADQRGRSGIPLSQGNMAKEQLEEFLQRQLYEPRSTSKSKLRHSPQRRSKSKRAKKQRSGAGVEVSQIQPGLSSLVPRHDSLDPFLARMFNFLFVEAYKAGCLVELLPAYLHFLARLGLIKADEMKRALTELHPLANQVIRLLERYGVYLHLVQSVTDAWSKPTLQAFYEDPALAESEARLIMPGPETVQSPTPKAPPRRPGSLQTYTFKVTYLQDPDIWRTIEITEAQTLDDLHYAIQEAVDFDDDHLYSFFLSGRAWDKRTEYTSPRAGGRIASQAIIGKLPLRMKQKVLYIFDYGHEHRFSVQLVAINLDASKDEDYPKIVESHGESPEQYPSWGWEEDEENEENEEDEEDEDFI